MKRHSLRALNGLNFFVADMLTGFGPFVTVYLAANSWKPAQIGVALSLGTAAAIVGQLPAGLLVDAVSRRRLITAVGIAAIIVSALVLGGFANAKAVFGAELLQGLAACLLTPAIAAITLSLSESGKLARQLGGNVRFKALGSVLAALLMGFVGSHVGPGAVFYVAAAFGGMALGCLWMISGVDIANAPHRTQHPTAWPKHARHQPLRRPRELWRDPALLTFGGCVFLFQLSNAAVLPFAVSAVEASGLENTDTLVAIALVVSQLVTAFIAPRLGASAEARGRKLILSIAFGALTLRCLVLSIVTSPATIVGCQLLDGVSASSIGVMVPLIIADITHHGGRFNLALSLVGLAMTAGAALSTLIAGFVTQRFGVHVTFLALAAAAALGCLLVALALPETGRIATGSQKRSMVTRQPIQNKTTGKV